MRSILGINFISAKTKLFQFISENGMIDNFKSITMYIYILLYFYIGL